MLRLVFIIYTALSVTLGYQKGVLLSLIVPGIHFPPQLLRQYLI